MSLELMAQVWKLEDLPSTEKFVLLAYANYANDEGLAWPSKETVARRTAFSKATVKRAVTKLCADARLVEMPLHLGYGADKKLREVRAYRVEPTGVTVNPVQSEPGSLSAATGVTESQKTAKTVSSGVRVNPNTVNNSLSLTNTRHRGILLNELPDLIDPSVARELIDHRHNLKKPLTQGAFNRLIATALRAPRETGVSPNAALQTIVDRGWQGLNLDWLKPKAQTGAPGNQRTRDTSVLDMVTDTNW